MNSRYRFKPVYSLSRRAPSADSDTSPHANGRSSTRNAEAKSSLVRHTCQENEHFCSATRSPAATLPAQPCSSRPTPACPAAMPAHAAPAAILPTLACSTLPAPAHAGLPPLPAAAATSARPCPTHCLPCPGCHPAHTGLLVPARHAAPWPPPAACPLCQRALLLQQKAAANSPQPACARHISLPKQPRIDPCRRLA